MNKYRNREEAGKILADKLSAYANREDVIVLALPRGGVPVAYEIANALHAPLDVFIVRKIGVPGHSELAMGAIAMGDVTVFNENIIRQLQVTQEEMNAVLDKEKKELKRREMAYRGGKPFPDLENKTIILVDDGIATGASMRAAVTALRELKPDTIIVAVPVAEKEMCESMQTIADRFVCPLQPIHFYAVGAWYDDFSQTEDDEVHTLLMKAEALFSHE